MAGEIHSNLRRRKIAWKDDRSTNKIYASGDRSALGANRTVADSRLKVGQQPKPHPSPKAPRRDGIRSADEYYRSQDVGKTVQQNARALGAPAKPGLVQNRATNAPAHRPQDPNASLTINLPAEINGVMQEVVNRLKEGQRGVVVYVQAGNSNLLKRARAALEMQVTREVITEEEYHECRLSYTPGAAEKKAIDAKLAPPAPRGQTAVVADTGGDVESLLADLEAEEAEDAARVAPAHVAQVDTSADVQDSPAPSYPTAPAVEEDEGDDIGDLLTPKVVPVPPVTNDELDRAVDTDKPVRVTDPDPVDYDKTFGTNKVLDAEEGLKHIDMPAEAMDGIGEAPKPTSRRPGRRSGRGS